MGRTGSNDAVSNTSASRRRTDRHDQALLAAEVRQLAAWLQTSGPLQRDALAKRCHTSWWHGTIESAIAEGVRQHKLRRLPFGFVAAVRPEPARTRTTPKHGSGLLNDHHSRSTHMHSIQRNAASATPPADDEDSRPPRLPEGTAEAMPVVLTVIAISLPVAFVTLAVTGGGVPLLVAAIVTVVLVCMAIAIVLRRKLADDAPPAPSSVERSPQAK